MRSFVSGLGVLLIIATWAIGLLVHGYGVLIAYQIYGIIGAIAAFMLPFISTIYLNVAILAKYGLSLYGILTGAFLFSWVMSWVCLYNGQKPEPKGVADEN